MARATVDRTSTGRRGTGQTATVTAGRLRPQTDLESEVLRVLRARAEAGQSPVTLRDVLGDVIASHLPLGGAGARPMEESDVSQVADTLVELLASLPQLPGPWADAIGPVYLTQQVRVLLGTNRPVSRQALADRVERRTLLGLRTSDRRTVYPAWQFRRRQVLPGLPDVLQAFAVEGSGREPVVDPWTLASWLRTPLDGLDGDSIASRLLAGDVDSALRAARSAAARWNR